MRKISLAGLAIVAMAFLCSIVFLPCLSHAGMEEEIEHLFSYIKTSGCTFNRNDNIYDGEEAGEHIRKKYAYAKRWIKTTEDFIRHAATKSSMSGKPYLVTCDGVEMPTAKWLKEELFRVRGNTMMSPEPKP